MTILADLKRLSGVSEWLEKAPKSESFMGTKLYDEVKDHNFLEWAFGLHLAVNDIQLSRDSDMEVVKTFKSTHGLYSWWDSEVHGDKLAIMEAVKDNVRVPYGILFEIGGELSFKSYDANLKKITSDSTMADTANASKEVADELFMNGWVVEINVVKSKDDQQ